MIVWLKQLGNWIARIVPWLGEAKQAWLAVLAIPGVFLICWAVLPEWEPRIRLTGMCLELLGLGTVAYGIRETQKLFSRPRLAEIARKWFGRFPKLKLESRIVVGAAHINFEGMASGSAFGSASLSTTASLEERVTFLERRMDQANVLIHETQQKVEEEARKRSGALDVARREREVGDEKNNKLIQEAIAGGLYLETTGVLWLLCGITFATASNEIANFFFGVK